MWDLLECFQLNSAAILVYVSRDRLWVSTPSHSFSAHSEMARKYLETRWGGKCSKVTSKGYSDWILINMYMQCNFMRYSHVIGQQNWNHFAIHNGFHETPWKIKANFIRLITLPSHCVSAMWFFMWGADATLQKLDCTCALLSSISNFWHPRIDNDSSMEWQL